MGDKKNPNAGDVLKARQASLQTISTAHSGARNRLAYTQHKLRCEALKAGVDKKATKPSLKKNDEARESVDA